MNYKNSQLYNNVLSSFSPNINSNPIAYSPAKINLLNSFILQKYNSLCSICFNKFIRPCAIKPCLHLFCFKCLLEWQKYNYSCPLCRTNIISILKI